MKVNKVFLEAVVAMAACTDQSQLRQSMEYIRLRKLNDGKIQLAATQGHFLCYRVVDADCLDGFDFSAGDLVIHADKVNVSIFKALIKKSVAEYGKHNAPTVIDVSSYVKSSKEVNYPNVDAITPTGEGYQELVVGLNAEYLLTMLEAMRQENKTTTVKLSFKALREAIGSGDSETSSVIAGLDKASPILVTVGDTSGVLMPVLV